MERGLSRDPEDRPPLFTLADVRVPGDGRDRLVVEQLSIPPGITAVVGPSGAGKTTLLDLLAGVRKPAAGTVTRGLPGDGPVPLFWVPPDDGLWPGVPVIDHLRQAAPDDTAAARAGAVLDAFGLAAVAEQTPDSLSRGERARLSTARAVASGAAVLVLDEPLSHLDADSERACRDALREFLRSGNRSAIIATHEPAVVLREADRVVGLRDGRVAFDGPVGDLYHRPPDPGAAALLGPCNWFAEHHGPAGVTGPVRPERLVVEPDDDGPLTVTHSRTVGPVAESTVTHGGQVHRLLHRPPERGPLSAGARAGWRVLAVVACAAALGGCAPAGGPELTFSSVRSFSLPSEGPQLPAPRGIGIGPGDERYVLDDAGRVLVYDADGGPLRRWEMPDNSAGNPEGVCTLTAPDGTLRVAVADTHYHRVVVFDADGGVITMFGRKGIAAGEFIYPVAVCTDDAGRLYVCEYGGNDRVQVFDPSADFAFLHGFGAFGTGPGEFQRPSGIVWEDGPTGGRVFVVDAFNDRVQVFADDGDYLGVLGGDGAPELRYPYDLAADPGGDLWAVEYAAGRVTRLARDGTLIGRFGSTGAGAGQFATPWGLAVDRRGVVWVADTGNRRIVELVP